MKKSISLGLTLAVTMAGALATSGTAMAAVAVVPPVLHNANICEAYYGFNAGNFYHQADGFYNWGPFNDTATCPLVISHTPGKTSGSVSLTYFSNSVFSCTLKAVRGNGSIAASAQKFSSVGPGVLTWNGVIVAPTMHYDITCDLPANGNGRIISINSSF